MDSRLRNATQGDGVGPSHGDTAFTVPLFDEFMLRIVPGAESQPIGACREPLSLHSIRGVRYTPGA
jgi:hypothetical protein